MRFKSRSRALAASALAASLGLAGLGLVAPAAQASEPTEATRIEGLPTYEGGTRYETAAEAATTAYPTGSDNVVLASGQKFPDALAAGGLAGQLDAPILLTLQAELPESTIEALAALDPTTVTIVGESEAVSDAVEAELVALGYATDRIGGADRFETAALIAEELAGDTAVLANGLKFPDALAISPGAHALELPLLLTTADTLQADAAAYLDANPIDNVIIVGDVEVVSQDIEDALEADGITVTRLGGPTRYETAIEIAEFHTTVGFTLDEVVLARGDKFPDALAGGPLAAQMMAPLVLTQSDVLTPATGTWLSSNCQEIDALTIMGGPVAISNAVVAAAQAAAQCDAPASLTTRPELSSARIVSTVTPAQANTANPAGTVVEYVFDETVLSVDVNDFRIVTADNTLLDANQQLVSVSGSTVLIRFTDVNATTGTGIANVNNFTLATVEEGAATDAQGQTSTLGDAAIGTPASSTTTAVANTTTAPDLRSVSGFRQANPLITANSTAVDFTFDEAAFVSASNGFNLVTLDGTVVACTAPTSATDPAGGTIAGGNGTTTITVTCPNIGATTIASSQIARAYVTADSVYDTQAKATADAGVDGNPLQSVAVSNSGLTTGADLVSVQFIPAGTGSNTGTTDQVLYTFDQVVAGVQNGELFVFYANGDQVAGPVTQVSVDGTRILSDVGAGGLTDAVGASVNDISNDGNFEAASAGVTPVRAGTSARTPGAVAGPDLVSVALASSTDAFNVTTYRATYTFDQAVGTAAPTSTSFHLYLANGVRLDGATCAAPTGATATNTLIVCTGFTSQTAAVTSNNTAGGPATAAAIGSATLGAVERGAVVGAAGSGNTNPNPIGAESTTGGTGTPA